MYSAITIAHRSNRVIINILCLFSSLGAPSITYQNNESTNKDESLKGSSVAPLVGRPAVRSELTDSSLYPSFESWYLPEPTPVVALHLQVVAHQHTTPYTKTITNKEV